MYINVNGNDYYIYVNEKINGFKKTVFLLHGWLMDCSTFDNVIDSLKDKYNLISFDLLGFGKSGNLKEAFSLKDYAFVLNEILNYYISKYALKCVYLFGHSFGGRIIIKYLSLYDNDFIKGIILCDSAGIKKKSFKKSFLIYKYKFKKFVFKGLSFCFKRYEIKYNSLMKTSGSSDYIAVNGALKATMSLALREDLFFYLKDIKVKTIVAWGKNDEVTPLNDAYLFKKEIENSKLILFENSGHFPYLSEEKSLLGLLIMLYQIILMINYFLISLLIIFFEYKCIKYVQDINYYYKGFLRFFYYFYIKNFYVLFLVISLFFDSVVLLIFNIIISLFLIYKIFKYKNIIKLKITKRIIMFFILNVILILFIMILFNIYFSLLLLPFINLFNIYVSVFIDYFLNLRYFYKARDKINNMNPYIISISGSSGKTSVKNIIYDLIKNDYISFKTKKSFNTLKGIEITINEIEDYIYEPYLVLEMGAKKRNDIRSICNLCKSNIAILTNILPQHLFSFGSVDNILKEKSNIIWSLKENGICIINEDDPKLKELIKLIRIKRSDVSIYTFSIIDKKAFIYAYDINFSLEGTCFNIMFNDSSYFIKTKLLGLHSVYNIMIALIVCFILNIDINKAILSIKHLDYLSNRLQIRKENNITILDDSYNSNISGFMNAINVLLLYDGKKFLISPGIVDCKGDGENEKIALFLSESDIFVILIRNKYINIYINVFKKTKFNDFIVMNSFNEAYNYVLNQANYYDLCVLIENDLTDNYYL